MMNRTIFRSLTHVLLYMLVVACITPYQPETKSLGSKTLIIDGYITNQPGPHQVILSYTDDFTYRAINLIVSGASVMVVDDQGKQQAFIEIGKGVYRTPAAFQGVAGRTYKLAVLLPDGRRFESKPELLKAAPAVDRLYDDYTEVPIDDGLAPNKGFDVYLDTKDPATTGDYYRWVWKHFEPLKYCNIVSFDNGPEYGIYCCQDCWDIIGCSGTNCVNVMTDEQVNGKSISRQFIARAPFSTNSGYYMEIEQLTITKEAYLFYKSIENMTKNNGSIFDAAPVALHGNIVSVSNPGEAVVGYFSVSGSQKVPYVVDRSKGIGTPNFKYVPLPLPGVPTCIACEESDYRTRIKPRWWPF